VTEAQFHDLVAAWLDENFVDIEHEPTLPETRHEPDFRVHTVFDAYVVEVEDGWDSVYTGIGQAFLYAQETDSESVLVLPADAVDPDDVEYVEAIQNLQVVFL